MNARNKTEIRSQFKRLGVFSESCTVYAETITISSSGGEIIAYAAQTGATNIPCIMMSQKSRMTKINGDSISQRSLRIKLNNIYSTIKPGMKVSCSNVDYRVSDVTNEGTGVFTILDVERWS